MVPLMVVYYFLQKYYRRTYVELQRCDATSRSPVYAHFSESLTGVETIRAFGYQQRFADKSDSQIDYNHRQAQLRSPDITACLSSLLMSSMLEEDKCLVCCLLCIGSSSLYMMSKTDHTVQSVLDAEDCRSVA